MTKTVLVDTTSAKGLRVSLNQSLLSFSFGMAGLLAGALLVTYFDVFSIKEAPWALVLFPGILSVRGAIGGLFSGHLSTSLHLGTVKPNYIKNTKSFYIILHAVITLALMSGITIGIGASLFGVFLWGATVLDFVKLLAVIIATTALSIVFISPMTIAVSILSFRRGLDPDIVVYPITAALSDVINTICYIFSLSIFFTLDNFGYYFIGIMDVIFLTVAVYIVARNISEEEFSKIIKEFLLTLVFVTFVVNVTGSFLGKISGIMSDGARIYAVYPALITTVGGVGSIIGSTATTKLALGVIEPSFFSMKQHLDEIGGSWIASIIMFLLCLIISSFASGMIALGDILKFTVQLLTTNVLAVFVMVIITYTVAVFTYRKGWNPDNFVIPIESSLADSITTFSLLMALTVIV